MRNTYLVMMRFFLTWRINGYARQRQQIIEKIQAARASYARLEQLESLARRNYRSLT